MNDNSNNNAGIFDIQSFVKQIEESGFTNMQVTNQFIAWVTANIPCEFKDKKLKKDALLLFQANNAEQFELYYQIRPNKLFLIIKMDKKSLADEVEKSLIPLFDDSYRKVFVKNRGKRISPWIDIEQLKKPAVFNGVTKLLTDFFSDGDSDAVSSGMKDKSDALQYSYPTKEDSEFAYRMLTRLDVAISIDDVLDQIESNANKKGITFKNDWRIVTEKNIENWAGNK